MDVLRLTPEQVLRLASDAGLEGYKSARFVSYTSVLGGIAIGEAASDKILFGEVNVAQSEPVTHANQGLIWSLTIFDTRSVLTPVSIEGYIPFTFTGYISSWSLFGAHILTFIGWELSK